MPIWPEARITAIVSRAPVWDRRDPGARRARYTATGCRAGSPTGAGARSSLICGRWGSIIELLSRTNILISTLLYGLLLVNRYIWDLLGAKGEATFRASNPSGPWSSWQVWLSKWERSVLRLQGIDLQVIHKRRSFPQYDFRS